MAPNQRQSRDDEQDDDKSEHEGPVRTCIVSGQRFPQRNLIRFVVGPDRTVVPDLEEKLPGRGFWLSADPDVINTACDKQMFRRAGRRKVHVSPTLSADIEALLLRRCLDRISLARRAGQAIAGFEKASIRLRQATVGLVFEANDGADGGKEKIRRLAGDAVVIDWFSAAELGSAVGTERTVHMVIEAGGLADGIVKDARRLERFRRNSAEIPSGDQIERTT